MRCKDKLKLVISFLILLPLAFPNSLRAETVTVSAVNYPPYEVADPQGGLRGFDVEVVEVAFKRGKILTDFKFMPWKRALAMTTVGQFTAILSCNYSPEREKDILFSEPISTSTDGFFIRRDYKGIQPATLQEAKGLKVAAILGWIQVKWLADAGVNVEVFRTEGLAFRELMKGLIDYVYIPLEGGGYIAKNLGISAEMKFLPIKEKNLYLCFSRKWDGIEEIAVKFNEGLSAVRADGTYDKIHAQYR